MSLAERIAHMAPERRRDGREPGGELLVGRGDICPEANRPEKGFAFLHAHLLVDRWDYQLVRRAIGDICSRTEGADWHEIAAKLRLYGDWEFEDYASGSLPRSS